MSRAPRTQTPRETAPPAPEPIVQAAPVVVADPEPGLLQRLDAAARAIEGADHVRHETLVALISRLSGLKHHLARLDGERLDASIQADLTTIAKLL
jgi:hypothetical protein